MEHLHPIKYLMSSFKCKTHGAEDATVYGIKTPDHHPDSVVFEDLGTNKEFVESFLHLINKEGVSPSQLLYVVEDCIAY